MRVQILVAATLLLGASSCAHLTRQQTMDSHVVWLLIGRCGFQLYESEHVWFNCGKDVTGDQLTADERAQILILLERISLETALSPYKVKEFPVIDNDYGVSLEYGGSRWYISAEEATSMPQPVRDLRDFLECCFRKHLGAEGFFIDSEGRYDVKPNCRLNPTAHRVTRLAAQTARRSGRGLTVR